MLKQAVAAIRGQTQTIELDSSDDAVIDGSQMQLLGTIGYERYPYIVIGPDEFKVTGVVGPHQVTDAQPKGQRLIRHRITRRVDGRTVSEFEVLRAVPVEPGEFAKRKAQLERREARLAAERDRARRPHLHDTLAGLPALVSKPISVLPVGPELNAANVNPGMGLLSKRAPVVRPASGPIVGPRAIIESLASRGVVLTEVSGGLLVTAKHISFEDRQVIEAAAPLLIGVLSGVPVPCALEHKGDPPEAISLAFMNVPACANCINEPAS